MRQHKYAERWTLYHFSSQAHREYANEVQPKTIIEHYLEASIQEPTKHSSTATYAGGMF